MNKTKYLLALFISLFLVSSLRSLGQDSLVSKEYYLTNKNNVGLLGNINRSSRVLATSGQVFSQLPSIETITPKNGYGGELYYNIYLKNWLSLVIGAGYSKVEYLENILYSPIYQGFNGRPTEARITYSYFDIPFRFKFDLKKHFKKSYFVTFGATYHKPLTSTWTIKYIYNGNEVIEPQDYSDYEKRNFSWTLGAGMTYKLAEHLNLVLFPEIRKQPRANYRMNIKRLYSVCLNVGVSVPF